MVTSDDDEPDGGELGVVDAGRVAILVGEHKRSASVVDEPTQRCALARGGRRKRGQAAVQLAQIVDADFPRVTTHDLRHTAASLAISAGANVKAVQRMLGHASAAMTLDTYADLFDDDLDGVASALDDVRAQRVVGDLWGIRA